MTHAHHTWLLVVTVVTLAPARRDVGAIAGLGRSDSNQQAGPVVESRRRCRALSAAAGFSRTDTSSAFCQRAMPASRCNSTCRRFSMTREMCGCFARRLVRAAWRVAQSTVASCVRRIAGRPLSARPRSCRDAVRPLTNHRAARPYLAAAAGSVCGSRRARRPTGILDRHDRIASRDRASRPKKTPAGSRRVRSFRRGSRWRAGVVERLGEQPGAAGPPI